jgi:phenylacetate-CoA ligase
MARNLWAAGVRKEDILQNAYGYGLFTGGLGFHQGATPIGCTVVPTSSGLTERQITIMKDFGTTVLCCTPSYALTIAERARELKVDTRSLALRVGVFGAEPWTAQMRQEIEERTGIKAQEAYGLTELGGPGVAFDCEAQDCTSTKTIFWPKSSIRRPLSRYRWGRKANCSSPPCSAGPCR